MALYINQTGKLKEVINKKKAVKKKTDVIKELFSEYGGLFGPEKMNEE